VIVCTIAVPLFGLVFRSFSFHCHFFCALAHRYRPVRLVVLKCVACNGERTVYVTLTQIRISQASSLQGWLWEKGSGERCMNTHIMQGGKAGVIIAHNKVHAKATIRYECLHHCAPLLHLHTASTFSSHMSAGTPQSFMDTRPEVAQALCSQKNSSVHPPIHH
jgi:hypothetical protein